MKIFRKIILLALVLCLGLSSALVNADDSGSSGESGGQGGTNTEGVSAYGHAYYWFDRGGWQDSTSGGSGVEPAQGIFHLGDSDVPDKMYETFMEGLNSKIPYPRGYHPNALTRAAGLRRAMKEACEKAIQKSGNPTQGARVVGVAITYSVYNGNWGIAPTWVGTNKFTDLFDGHGATESELPDKYGWGTEVNENQYSRALPHEKWRDYIYRIGAIDSPGDGSEWQVYVVAVTDTEPSNPSGSGKVKKTY